MVAATVKVPHRRELVTAARAAGKAVYCESPLGSGKLGEAIGADRVFANTMDAHDRVQLGAQWHMPDLLPQGELG